MMQKSSIGQSALDAKYREMDYDRHVKKITAIIESRKAKLTANQIAEFKESFMNAKSLNIRFNDISKQQQINQQNEAMLCKLIEISQGKSCFLNQPQFTGNNQTHNQQQQKPLHLPFRQEKLRQIDEENKALQKRIVDQKSFINRDKMQKEINKYEKLKRHMQKFKSVGNFSQKPLKLPPILNKKSVLTGNFEQNASLLYESKTTTHQQSKHKKIVQDFFNDEKGSYSSRNYEQSRLRSNNDSRQSSQDMMQSLFKKEHQIDYSSLKQQNKITTEEKKDHQNENEKEQSGNNIPDKNSSQHKKQEQQHQQEPNNSNNQHNKSKHEQEKEHEKEEDNQHKSHKQKKIQQNEIKEEEETHKEVGDSPKKNHGSQSNTEDHNKKDDKNTASKTEQEKQQQKEGKHDQS